MTLGILSSNAFQLLNVVRSKSVLWKIPFYSIFKVLNPNPLHLTNKSCCALAPGLFILNTIVAKSIDELAEKIKAKTRNAKNINQAVFDVLRSESNPSVRSCSTVTTTPGMGSQKAKRRGLPIPWCSCHR